MASPVGDGNPRDEVYERLLNQEQLILEATELVHELLNATGATKADLAERLGTTRGYVTQVLNGTRNMTLRTLADLGFALGYRVTMSAVPLDSTQMQDIAVNSVATG
jgi:transcriptional regulator with XRE-family HTH domain